MKGPKTPPRAKDSGMEVPETVHSPGFIGSILRLKHLLTIEEFADVSAFAHSQCRSLNMRKTY